MDQIQNWIDAARAAREHAHAPFSGFQVGAVLAVADGAVVAGANFESDSFGLTVCAERNALMRAVYDGHRSFQAIAVVADSSPLATPCGACRQVLSEFAGPDLRVILADLAGRREVTTLGELLPRAFSRNMFAGGATPEPRP